MTEVEMHKRRDGCYGCTSDEPEVCATNCDDARRSVAASLPPEQDEQRCEHGETEAHAFMERRQRDCELPEGWCPGPVADPEGTTDG